MATWFHPSNYWFPSNRAASVEGRLLDFDDRVRMQAVAVACDICSSNLKRVPLKLMAEATERLRDKKACADEFLFLTDNEQTT